MSHRQVDQVFVKEHQFLRTPSRTSLSPIFFAQTLSEDEQKIYDTFEARTATRVVVNSVDHAESLIERLQDFVGELEEPCSLTVHNSCEEVWDDKMDRTITFTAEPIDSEHPDVEVCKLTGWGQHDMMNQIKNVVPDDPTIVDGHVYGYHAAQNFTSVVPIEEMQFLKELAGQCYLLAE